MHMLPDPPLPRNIRIHLESWRDRPDYKLQENALALLFKKCCPGNVRPEHILLKVSVLNDFYGTNIYDKYSVTNHIVALQIDSRLNLGDLTLINEIAKVKFKNGIRNVYSFATKYCNHHNSDAFPIFDQYVERMLVYFRIEDNFAKFTKSSLRNYEEFVKVIRNFQKFYGLSDFSLREIDIYLWLAGKKAFQ